MTREQRMYLIKLELASLKQAMADNDTIAVCALIGQVLGDAEKLVEHLEERRKGDDNA